MNNKRLTMNIDVFQDILDISNAKLIPITIITIGLHISVATKIIVNSAMALSSFVLSFFSILTLCFLTNLFLLVYVIVR